MRATGSSPLARGLRQLHGCRQSCGRIIPARAGFTAARPTSPCSGRDHPRSRGVYARAGPTRSLSGGSSPLARGLRPYEQQVRLADRIIPARAGFTVSGGNSHSTPTDHPRSRGVYCRRVPAHTPTAGSSPLARGLPRLAGPTHVDPLGSSPLARGLRRGRSRRKSGSRIIPARAGFTVAGGGDARVGADHPRSRGVYATVNPFSWMKFGSSPLARGLRPWCASRPCRARIIPARAGFTRGTGPPPWGTWDHPRSRGVYKTGPPYAGRALGSSPLARGLPNVAVSGDAVVGIIPARAGFTCSTWCRPRARRDHPRSRGVYIVFAERIAVIAGSSPLARGLQHLGALEAPVAGIIPARAGFTEPHPQRAHQDADHPRSRGVYDVAFGILTESVGSSPLARGLHRGAGQGGGQARIIPARAGFTIRLQIM